MKLTSRNCYEAVRSRDARFDGRFFSAVVTTGIYCRPICPARTPRERNLRFYATAAAAEAAGFRPCRRCRPDAAPGTPLWNGASGTVSRALRLIADGFLDGESAENLAARLGVGSRQLGRIFRDHLGAPPGAVARTRRVHFARQLIDETSLSMTQVAFHSGFSSVRAFNTAIRKSFGRTPSELRRRRREPATGGGDLHLFLPYRPPFEFRELLHYLEARAIPGVESVHGDRYRRSVTVGGMSGRIEVGPVEGRHGLWLRLNVEVGRNLLAIVERVRQQFDLLADPATIAAHLGKDRTLGPLVRRYPGGRVPGCWDGFELAVRAILGQQVTVRGASTLAGRLAESLGEIIGDPGAPGGGPHLLFPTPETIARAELSELGMPESRKEAIRALARSVAEGAIDFRGSMDPDEVKAKLLRLPGVGPWTAEYIAMRALREPDAFPATDLGLRKAAARDAPPWTPSRLARVAESWRPWRAYAAALLWRSLGDGKKSRTRGARDTR